ncbi:CBS domain-containing protein [Desulfatitalea alkaliphila]|uniref:CBS domain-containing protein n=1 Tax=Desulfatitalea alkaliphila TaxID=2929485 RepID=A0AA41QZ05_9BACT|nr:CBS domain-containing protein [Desulfatitalea alkaliphila]MCJ8499027.1 CBS domain-containing protein [Desulfatitalea alkaliphila]
MKVKEVMSSEVAVIQSNSTIQEAAERMKDLNVGDLPVVVNDEAVGFITDRDITVRAVALGLDTQATSVVNAMTEGILACNEEDDVQNAVKTMADKNVRRMAVVNDKQQLIGIISLNDLAAHADDHMAKEVLKALAR